MPTTSVTIERPKPGEYNPYYDRYISLVLGNDILEILEKQLPKTLALLSGRSEGEGNLRYAPGKWTLKEVLGHLNDTERIMGYRALRIARGDQNPLPGFEQADYVQAANFNSRSLAMLLEEFRTVREATLALFWDLPVEAWSRRGTVSGYSATVRGLAFTSAGHERHHMKILRESGLF